MKKILILLSVFVGIFYAATFLPACKGKTVVPTVSELPKPSARTIPDSEFCKSISIPSATTRAVGVRGNYWNVGQTLKIKLMGGTAAQRAYLTNAVLEWQKYVNLNVSYVTTGTSDIRVAFVSGGGSWSYCGTEAKNIAQTDPTINIGWSGSDVCLHELGHAWGAAHEQSSPNNDIQWNKTVVYAALGGPPNNWNQATVDWNVFRKLTATEAEATVFDPASIMQYSVPASWTYNYPNGIAGGKVLSAKDIEFWSSKYPKDIQPPNPTTWTVTKAQRDNIKRITAKVKAANDIAKIAADSLAIINAQVFGVN